MVTVLGGYTHAQEHVYDFISIGYGSDPEPLFATDEYVLISASGEDEATDLYVSDGTAEGTELIKTFEKDNTYQPRFLEFAGKTFFTRYNSDSMSIWYTDGTAAGTKKYFEAPRTNYGLPLDMVAFNGWLFYLHQTPQDSLFVMRVDSTLTESKVAAEHKMHYNAQVSHVVATQYLLFYAFGDMIYRIDNSFSKPLKYFEYSATSDYGNIDFLIQENGALIWSYDSERLYAGRGAMGSGRVIDRFGNSDRIWDQATLGDYVFFNFGDHRSANLGRLHARDLTFEVVGTNNNPYIGERAKEVEVHNGVAYFDGNLSGDTELWKTGEKNSETQLVRDIASDGVASEPSGLTSVGGKLFFSAHTEKFGRELWVSDGTFKGTQQVVDLVPQDGSSYLGMKSIAFKDKLITTAYTERYGTEIWVSDGTAKGTELLLDINPEAYHGHQRVGNFMQAGPYLYLFANDSIHGRELWRTDGTKKGTVFLDDLSPGLVPAQILRHTEYKGHLFGTAVSFIDGIELYTSNGKPEGTRFVTPSDILSSSAPEDYCVLNDKLYYIGDVGFAGLFGSSQLFVSDGSTQGTKPFNEGHEEVFANALTLARVGQHLFFAGGLEGKGMEPFMSDGTLAGTKMIADLATGEESSDPAMFAGSDSSVYFVAKDSRNWQLCHFNPYIEGSLMSYSFADLGIRNDAPDTLFVFEDEVYMIGDLTSKQNRLFKLDLRNKTSTLLDSQSNTGLQYQNPSRVQVLGRKLVFAASSSESGRELYASDGTAQGTYRIADLYPGRTDANPGKFVHAGNQIAFVASTPAGKEVWVTDGTPTGNRQLITDSYKPKAIAYYRGYLYFSGNDAQRSKSLFRLALDSCAILSPQVRTQADYNGFCQGGSVELEASSGLPYDKLSWLKNGTALAGNKNKFTATQTGAYQVVMERGSCQDTSRPLEVHTLPPAQIEIAYENDSGFCKGGWVKLVLPADSGRKVKWYRNGSKYVEGDEVTARQGGAYYAIANNDFGCLDTSRSLEVTEYQDPKPEVLWTRDTLWSSIEGAGYQWYFKGVEIEGATNRFVELDEPGAYKVAVVSEEGCTGESQGFKYGGVGIGLPQVLVHFEAYPNPFENQVSITYHLVQETQVLLELYDLSGQRIATLVNSSQAEGMHQLQPDCAVLPGVYVLRMSLDGARTDLRLVKMR